MIRNIKGKQGVWFVDVDGERMPCLKQHHRGAGPSYRDPGPYDPTKPKHAEYLAGLQQSPVVVARYETQPGKADKRIGYEPGIFRVTDVRTDADGVLHCRFAGSVKR